MGCFDYISHVSSLSCENEQSNLSASWAMIGCFDYVSCLSCENEQSNLSAYMGYHSCQANFYLTAWVVLTT